ncbi:MAG: MFS transporter [Clostridia bacterium]|nr:MFS transporter [Clostridia bacterium]
MENIQPNKKFDYKWVIIALSFMMVFIVLGFCSSSKDLYLKPMTEALSMKRSVFSVNDSCRYVTTAIVNLFFGALVAKFGTKKLIVGGFLSLILSCISYCVATNVFMLCVGGCLLGVGLAWTTTTMVGSVINKWCTKNKGTIMGAILASNGIGSMVATWLITYIKSGSNDPFAYRKAYVLTTIILACMAALILIFYKEPPKQNANSDGDKKKGKGNWEGIDWNIGSKKAYFFFACISIFLTGLVLHGVYGVRAAHLEDSGVNSSSLATIISINMLLLTCTKFSTGFIYDRFGIRAAMNICLVSSVAVMTCFYFVSGSGVGLGCAYAYAVFSALSLPLDTIMLPIYADELFGAKSYNKFLGIFVSVKEAGYAVGSIVINAFYDYFGSYKVAFVVCGIAMIGVFAVMQYVVSAAKKMRVQN